MSGLQQMPKEIVEAIGQMMLKVGYIQKKGENKFHGYKYASIEDVLDKVQPALAEVGLVITQDEQSHQIIAEGQLMEAVYAFGLYHKNGTSAPIIRHTGLAALRNSKGGYDDKALNKCHTAARKYFILGLFQIPTGLAVDPDEDEDKPHSEPRPPLRAVEPPQSTMAGRKNEAAGVRAGREWANESIAFLKSVKTAEAFSKWYDDPDTEKRRKFISREIPEDSAALETAINKTAERFNTLAAG